MAKVRFTAHDELVSQVKRMAQARQISEPDMWRLVVERGIVSVELSGISDDLRDEIRVQMDAIRAKLRGELLGDMTRLTVENLCLTRRLVGSTNESLVRLAKEDARAILEQMEGM